MITERELYEMYDEMLNDCHDNVTIGSIELSPSEVLRRCDNIAYRCGFSDYINSLLEGGVYTEEELVEAGAL